MAKTEYTQEEVDGILRDLTQRKIRAFEQEITKLRKREELRGRLNKAIVPPHRHDVGQSVGSGIEDIPSAKLSQSEESPGEHSRGEHSPDELCKMCGKSHGLGKACMSKNDAAASAERALEAVRLADEKKAEEGRKKLAERKKAAGIKDEGDNEPPPGLLDDPNVHKSALDEKVQNGEKPKQADLKTKPKVVPAHGSGGQVKRGPKALKKSALEKFGTMSADPGMAAATSMPGAMKAEKSPESSPEESPAEHECPACGSDNVQVLGSLGNRQHSRCKACGMDSSTTKAEPPTAKPPSGMNMATKVPTSAPKAPKMTAAPMAPPKSPGAMKAEPESREKVWGDRAAKEGQEKKDKEANESHSKEAQAVRNGKSGKPWLKAEPESEQCGKKVGETTAGGKPSAHVCVLPKNHQGQCGVKKKELEKGVMSDIARQNSPPGPAAAVSAPKIKMPTPEQHAVRADMHQQAAAGAFHPKAPVVSGLELQPKRPGIFSKIPRK